MLLPYLHTGLVTSYIMLLQLPICSNSCVVMTTHHSSWYVSRNCNSGFWNISSLFLGNCPIVNIIRFSLNQFNYLLHAGSTI